MDSSAGSLEKTQKGLQHNAPPSPSHAVGAIRADGKCTAKRGLGINQNNHPAVARSRNAAAAEPLNSNEITRCCPSELPSQAGRKHGLRGSSRHTDETKDNDLGSGIRKHGLGGSKLARASTTAATRDETKDPDDVDIEWSPEPFEDEIQPEDIPTTTDDDSAMVGLAVALPVESGGNLMTAEPVDPTKGTSTMAIEEKDRWNRNFIVIPGILILVVLCAVAIILAIVFSSSKDNGISSSAVGREDNTATTNGTISLDSMNNHWPPSKEEEVFPLPNYTRLTMEYNIDSAQSKAYMWLAQDPNLDNYTRFRREQRFALATIYYSMDGHQWERNNGWTSYDVDECMWYFAERKTSGSPCVYGSIYRVLWLRKNQLKGTIPPELQLMNWLADIQLEDNPMIKGTLPTELFRLRDLHTIWIWGTSIEGTIPSEIGSARRMFMFFFDRTMMEGSLPTEIGHLSELILFSGAKTQLTGIVPSALGHCTEMKIFDLAELGGELGLSSTL
ncbi:Leucine Rich Repeat [Seminavis robusta]|uniref:Leucine Rich Repeat n=1 Tax=Seminavis robusta TaxID=568900 RepID=A0A9N8DER1_9STRA|nr:Leucine Rich Repeat [Seminavis robusta]|eukprot:Sro36_g022810.1 Leucine Rich Repeat (503) ;mRNA; f:67465-69071